MYDVLKPCSVQYDLAREYFGDEIRFFINSVAAGWYLCNFLHAVGEEIEEESSQEEDELHTTVSIPNQTEEMEKVEKVEEALWREENLATERDLEIADFDLPERMQLVEGKIRYILLFTTIGFCLIDEEEMDYCVDWIYNNLIKYNAELIYHQRAAVHEIEQVIKLYAVGYLLVFH